MNTYRRGTRNLALALTMAVGGLLFGITATTHGLQAAVPLEMGLVSGVDDDGWTPVSLSQTYSSMVVVTTPVYDSTSPPAVVRIRNASGSGFDVRLDRMDGITGNLTARDVYYLVVEEGNYTNALHGIQMEAARFSSTVTANSGNWVSEPHTYVNAYTSPVVLGQVLTYVDSRPSVFFSHGPNRHAPPSVSVLNVGKHVGQDPDTNRGDETLGLVVMEAGTWPVNNIALIAGVGDDIVRGMDNAPPYDYPLDGLAQANAVVASATGMDGADGAWAVLHGASPLSATNIALSIDEDRMADTERAHTTEQVAYIVAGVAVNAGEDVCGSWLPAAGTRDDVLVLVNDNSNGSCEIGSYYASRRGLGSDDLLHLAVPPDYFMTWDEFRIMRDQIIRHLQARLAAEQNITPVVCADGDAPYYCEASTQQLRDYTSVRYLVVTRGVPTRVTVDGSTLDYPSATSVDNYLLHWITTYYSEDVVFGLSPRAAAFADGRGMRAVEPATDNELIVGRIGGITVDAAKAVIDRTLAAEDNGLYGKLYGSQFNKDPSTPDWTDHASGARIYGDSSTAWRYQLGVFGEDRPECIDYLAHPHNVVAGKAPDHCYARLTDGADPGPSAPSSRQPVVHDALVYQGNRDNSRTATGVWSDFMNWRRDTSCSVTMCNDAADPVACRAASIDVKQEINTQCVGVADGFIGFNMQSFPLSYMTIWPTGWQTLYSSRDNLAFPEVLDDLGRTDSTSLVFRNTHQVAEPLCYASSNFSQAPDQPCRDELRIQMIQKITLDAQSINPFDPQAYRIGLWYRAVGLEAPTTLRTKLRVHEQQSDEDIDYGYVTLATLMSKNTGWSYAEATVTVDPALHESVTATIDAITVELESAEFTGEVGIDDVQVEAVNESQSLVINPTFAEGHTGLGNGDYAASFLSRLNGVAFWGSVSHHESGGFSFADHPIPTLLYFIRGLALGDAVWFAETHNSGIFYGDPLYSPTAVRLDYPNNWDYVTGLAPLTGSAVNGRDGSIVTTVYSVDYCQGHDFFVCDQSTSWLSTGIAGIGGFEDMSLGTWNTFGLAPGAYTLRLTVTSDNVTTARTQTLHDFQTVTVYDPSGDDDADGLVNGDEVDVYGTDPTHADVDSDGLMDGVEIALLTDPFDADSDDDGLSDGWEVDNGTEPMTPDAGLDPDADGLTNMEEFQAGTAPLLSDSDGDGLTDLEELVDHFTDPVNADTDGDALDDGVELLIGTDPLNADTDNDGMTDGWEVAKLLDPFARDGSADPDGDNVENVLEFLRDTNPLDAGSLPVFAVVYVDVANTTGIEDGTPANPYASIKQALTTALAGDTLAVQPGFYSVGSLTLAQPVRLTGVAPGVQIVAGYLDLDHNVWGVISDLDLIVFGDIAINGTQNVRMEGLRIVTGWGTNVGDGAQLTFAHCVFDAQGADTALRISDASVVQLVNVTVAGFSTGIQSDDPTASLIMRNTIVANAIDLDGIDDGSGIHYSLLSQGNFAGVNGNIAGDPLFVNALFGDYRLQAGSPAIDAGDPASPYNNEPAANGCRINLGAYGNTAQAAVSAFGC